MFGISARHGPHQDAQKLRKTGCPRKSERLRRRPSKAENSKLGARFPVLSPTVRLPGFGVSGDTSAGLIWSDCPSPGNNSASDDRKTIPACQRPSITKPTTNEAIASRPIGFCQSIFETSLNCSQSSLRPLVCKVKRQLDAVDQRVEVRGWARSGRTANSAIRPLPCSRDRLNRHSVNRSTTALRLFSSRFGS